MSNRIRARNAYESPLGPGGAAPTGSFSVENPEGLVAPGYLVLDPEDTENGLREYIRFTAVNGTTGELTCGENDRGLLGSASPSGGVAHAPGAPARMVAVSQWLDDIYDNIETIEGWQSDHSTLNNPGDPHPEYMTQVESDTSYVNIDGDAMTGLLLLSDPPSADLGAATKLYVDEQDHDHATPIGEHADISDAHHARYTDDEAIAAVGDPGSGVYLPLAGGTLTGLLRANGGIAILSTGIETVDAAAKIVLWESQDGTFVRTDENYNGPYLSLVETGLQIMYGNLRVDSIYPNTDGTYDLGLPGERWNRVYAHDAHLTRILDENSIQRLDLNGSWSAVTNITAGGDLIAGDDVYIGGTGGPRIQYASSQIQLIHPTAGKGLLIGTGAVAPMDNGATDLGANNAYEWANVYAANVVAAAWRGVPMENLGFVLNALIAHANANGAAVPALA